MMYIDLGFCFLPSQAQLATSAESLDTIPAGVSIQEWNDAAQLICIRICFRISNIFFEGILYIYRVVFGFDHLQSSHTFPSIASKATPEELEKAGIQVLGTGSSGTEGTGETCSKRFPIYFCFALGFHTDSSTIYIFLQCGAP